MKRIILILVLSLVITSCLKHKTVNPINKTTDTTSFTCGDTIYFNTELMTEIFTPSCNTLGCHGNSNAGGYTFLDHSDISSNANLILRTIIYDNNVKPMPLGAKKLNDTLINKFYCWKNQGKLNN